MTPKKPTTKRKPYRTTRRIKTKKKTTTEDGKREYQRKLMRERRKEQKALINFRPPSQTVFGHSFATEVTGFHHPRDSIIADMMGLQGFNEKKKRVSKK